MIQLVSVHSLLVIFCGIGRRRDGNHGIHRIWNEKTSWFSEYDITDSTEESDPFEVRFGKNNTLQNTSDSLPTGEEIHYCHYCGTKVNVEFEFCHKCVKKLP